MTLKSNFMYSVYHLPSEASISFVNMRDKRDLSVYKLWRYYEILYFGEIEM